MNRLCIECNIEFEVNRPNKIYCSKKCGKKAEKRRYAKTEGFKRYRNSPEAKARLKERNHKFWTSHKGKIASAKKNHKRRALKNGSKVEEIDYVWLFERDGGKCGICGKKIDSSLQYPHPKSKSIDHIVPLIKGGTHTHGNLQYVHIGCNWSKNAKIYQGVQQRLF